MKVTEHVSNAGHEPRIEVDITVKGHKSGDLQQACVALAEHVREGIEEVEEVLG